MWAYHTREQIVRRLSCHRGKGFWLDYWLFLHTDDALPSWKARPLSVADVASVCLVRQSSNIVEEVASCAKLAATIGYPVPDEPLDARAPLDPAWRRWLEEIREAPQREAFVRALGNALDKAIDADAINQIAYLSRRLAGELSETSISARDIFVTTTKLMDQDPAGCPESLVSHFVGGTVETMYEVRFSLSEAAIPSRAAMSILVRGAQLTFSKRETEPNDQQRARTLTGIVVQVEAEHPAAAYRRAGAIAQAVLEILRTRHYVRTNFVGAARVRPAGCDEADDVIFSLNQPFWTRKGGRGRATPTLPKRFGSQAYRLEKAEGERWLAMRWHVSQALRAWPEDIHSAASSVWQGLESLCAPDRKSNFERVEEQLIPWYSRLASLEMLKYLSVQVRRQIGCYRQNGGCDWRSPAAFADPISWCNAVTDTGSSAYFKSWRTPRAPDLLFHPAAGLIRNIVHRGEIRTPEWLPRRLKADLRHLYAVRNYIVHGGRRIGSPRWVNHLASTGLEVMFELANDRLGPACETERETDD